MLNFPKIFGWVLLVGGVLIILWTLYYSFNIFTGKTAAPEIFKVPVQAVSAPAPAKVPTSIGDIQQELGNVVGEQLKSMLPTDTLPKILNLTILSMLAGLLIFGGSQVASLGIKLIK